MLQARTSLLLTTLASVAYSQSTPYYVSSTWGNDANSGLYPNAPWASLAKVAAFAPKLQAGDSVLFRQGDTWNISSQVNITGVMGAVAAGSAPITFGAYRDATSPDQRPVMMAVPGVNVSGCLWNIAQSGGGITITGLEFIGGESNVCFTWAQSNQAQVYTGFTISDNSFRNATGLYYDPGTGSWWGVAVAFAGGPGGNTMVTAVNVTVANNVATHCDTFYQNSLMAPTYAGWTRVYVDGLQLVGNTLTSCRYNVVFLDTTTRVNISGNVFMRNTPDRLFVAGTTDLIFGSLDATCTINNNEIGYRGEFQPGGPDGCAVDFETSAIGTTVAGNFIHHSFGAGIMVFGHTVGSKNITLADNLLLFDGCNQTRDDRGGIAFVRAGIGASGYVTGNAIKTCPGGEAYHVVEPGAMDNFTFTGNIIDGVNGGVVNAVPVPTVSLVSANATAIVLTAACDASTPSCLMTYTTDGSRPLTSSPQWPGGSGGMITLSGRTWPVWVKAWPAGGNGSGGQYESPSAGGAYGPIGQLA